MTARLKPNPLLNLTAVHKAFSFQREACDAIKENEYSGVFHEQGLGKTKIAIDVLLHWLASDAVDSVVVVTKKGLVPNWVREFQAHTKIKPRILGSNRAENFQHFNSAARVFVTHYEVLVAESERFDLFTRTRRLGAVLDESQKIKNPDARISKAAFKLAPGFHRRLILTGTPIANRPFDIWSQIYFLDQGQALGTGFSTFREELDLPKTSDRSSEQTKVFERALSGLFARVSSFCVRETKDGGVIELPEKIIANIACDWETRQWELYRSLRTELSAQVVREGNIIEERADEVLKRLLRLVQVASNPALVDESYVAEPGKFGQLDSLVHQIGDAGEKAIIWSSFTGNVDWLARQLKEFRPRRVHGKMSYADRNQSITTFLDDSESKLLIATPGAAKEGLTLTVANHVIFYDRGFSLDDYLQAQDRIHRISQEQTCYVHNLVLENSIDEWVDVLIDAKTKAAKLGMGDIDTEEYQAVADYSFNDIVAAILDPDEEMGDKG